jgi:DHA1 family multidrug resistance protein-like MFS transporter
MSPGARLIPVATFFASFAWSFVFVSLPFHIQGVSTLDEAATLRWTGWIVGITSLVTVLTAPLWGRLAERGDPKRYYVLTESLQGIGFAGVAAARTLLELFFARFVLGFMGASSTFAFMLAARARDPGEVRRQVAIVQAALTVGGVIGPLAGAIAAARLGFRASFLVGGLILLGCSALVLWGVTIPAELQGARAGQRRLRVSDVAIAAVIVLVGSTQLFFLAPVLPQVLLDLGVEAADTLEIGGVVMFVSSAAAASGAFAAPHLVRLASERRLLATLLIASSVFMAILGMARPVWLYTLIRFVQVLCIAPVFPLVVGRIAQHAGGDIIGLVNSARIAAAFVGPVLATSLLAWASAPIVYLAMGALGAACLPLVALPSPADRGHRPPGRRALGRP